MSKNIFRVEKNKYNPFVQMYKEPLNNAELSFKAKGILAYLLSKPDDWQVYEVDLQKHATDGKTSISNGIKELIDKGYIDRSIMRNDRGHFKGYEYKVYEVPNDREVTESRLSDMGLSDNGKSDTTNNNITKNKETNINNGHQQQINAKPVYYLQKVANDEIVSICEYYDKKYYSVNNKVLRLKPHQWVNVRKVLAHYLNENQLTIADMKSVIDRYFDKVDSNDYNILHFISGDIIKHQIVDLGLAHYSEVE